MDLVRIMAGGTDRKLGEERGNLCIPALDAFDSMQSGGRARRLSSVITDH